MDRNMDRLINKALVGIFSENLYSSYFNPSSYNAIIFYSFRLPRGVVIIGILICGSPSCPPQAGNLWLYGQKHGQEHGQANKQSIRQYSSLKISILAISIPPVILQLRFTPSNYRAALL